MTLPTQLQQQGAVSVTSAQPVSCAATIVKQQQPVVAKVLTSAQGQVISMESLLAHQKQHGTLPQGAQNHIVTLHNTSKLPVKNNGKVTVLLKSLTRQHIEIKIITYLCLIKYYNIISCSETSVLLCCIEVHLHSRPWRVNIILFQCIVSTKQHIKTKSLLIFTM
jgi:hypothetical protein